MRSRTERDLEEERPPAHRSGLLVRAGRCDSPRGAWCSPARAAGLRRGFAVRRVRAIAHARRGGRRAARDHRRRPAFADRRARWSVLHAGARADQSLRIGLKSAGCSICDGAATSPATATLPLPGRGSHDDRAGSPTPADSNAGLDTVDDVRPASRQSRVSRAIRSRRMRSCAPASAGLDRRARVVANAIVSSATSRRAKQSSGAASTGGWLWAIALVRHRRRRAGSGRLLRRQRNGATQVGRKTKAIAAAGRTTSSCRHQRGGRPLGRCRQRATSRALLLFGPVLGTCVPRGKVAASASGSRTAAWACGSDQSQVFAGARSGEPGWPARVCRFHGRHVPPKSR